ncbi:hypothetical protein [Rhodococcus koreensis]
MDRPGDRTAVVHLPADQADVVAHLPGLSRSRRDPRQVGQHPDPTVAHTLAVAAGYAYSDPAVVMMLARMGLTENHCLQVAISVDAMFARHQGGRQ